MGGNAAAAAPAATGAGWDAAGEDWATAPAGGEWGAAPATTDAPAKSSEW